MAKANVKRRDHGDGADFINAQRARDEAKKEQVKASLDKEKLSAEDMNRRDKNADDSEVSQKGTGSGTHNTTGD